MMDPTLDGSDQTPIHATTIRVSRTTKKKKRAEDEENIDEDIISVHRFATTPALVSVTLGGTVNLGDYQSAKFSVTISKPCYKEELDDTYEEVKQCTLAKAMEVISEYRRSRG